ncbi:MAG: ATPase, T2SS/T4P/T4SS family [bacterium]|nr:ATPase, T2SS/T4P/T4SS family [bacterium]
MVMKLGEILVKDNLISADDLNSALKEQQKTSEPLAKVLIKMGYLKEEELLPVLSKQLEIPIVDIKKADIDAEAVKKVPAKFAWHYKIMPLRLEGNTLTVATSDPLHSLNDLQLFLGVEIKGVLAPERETVKTIKKYYGVGAETVESIMAKQRLEREPDVVEIREEVEDIEKMAAEASVLKLVNQIILDAHKARATDIHIEPFRGKLGLRYRIDGVLYNANVPVEMSRLFHSIISRIKIMSKLDIVERRLPQDGRASIKIGKDEFDLRISVIPTRHGESLVVRVLPAKMLFSLEKLGLKPGELKIMEELVKKPNGIIFVTGPTGSGKTTTLYACLNKIKSPANKIITLEDPIEYEIEGVTQIQVMPEIGFSFAQGLRSVLRHDPDIMMVGEVRDYETAELAIRIALTGHLIFSTVHTNDAAGGITRLINIGIEPFLITSSVESFIAQRLVRVICPECKEEDLSVTDDVGKMICRDIENFNAKQKSGNLIEFPGQVRFYKGSGCDSCNHTGYKQRSAIYEILLINRAVKELILEKASTDRIRDKAIEQGMKTLRVSGWEKVLEGLTTPEEVMRVTQTAD